MSSANVDILLGMFPNLPKEKALAFLAKAGHNLEAAIDQALEYTVQSESQIRVPVNQPPVSFDPPRTPSRTPASPLTSSVTPEARAANAAFNHALEQKLTKIRMNANPANQIQGFEALIREQGEQVNVLNLGADLMRRELLEEREKIRSTTAELQVKEQQLAEARANADDASRAMAQQRERFLTQSKQLEDELAKANQLLEDQMTKSQIHRFQPQVEAQRDQRMLEMTAALQSEIATLTEQRDGQSRDLASRDAAMKTLQTILQKQNIEILHLREEDNNAKKLIANLKTQIEDAKEAKILPVAVVEPDVIVEASAEIPVSRESDQAKADDEAKLEAVRVDLAATLAKLASVEDQLSVTTKEKDSLIKELQEQLSERVIELENLRSQLATAPNMQDELLSNNLQLQDQLEELKAQLAALTDQKTLDTKMLEESREEFKAYALQLEQELRQLREQHTAATDNFKTELEGKEQERLALVSRVAELSQELQQLREDESPLAELRAQLDTQAEELKLTKRELEAVQALAQAETESLKSIASETLSDSGLLSFASLLRTSQDMVRSSQEILKMDVLQSSQEIHEEKMSFIQEIEKQKLALKTTIAQLQTDLASCAQDIEDELAQTAAKANKLEAENDSLKSQVGQIDTLQEQLDQSQMELRELRNRFESQSADSTLVIQQLQTQVSEQQAASELRQKEAVRVAMENFTQSIMQDFSQAVLSRSQTYMN